MAIPNIYTAGLAAGWKVIDASTLSAEQTIEVDVAIVGSGAGGGVTAEILSHAGLKVAILEEGPLKTSDSFKDMDEARAFNDLYQEGGGRATSDGAISILQGRSVGGSTTVNWTSSFRTPPQTLEHWAKQHKVVGHSPEEMAPWFAKMEERLGIAPWAQAPNENNSILKRACDKLGWEAHAIPRNVKGCWNSGYCGMGCPVNAKQSMLVSTIPSALEKGAVLVHHLRVIKLVHDGKKVSGLQAEALGADLRTPTGVKVSVRAKHYVASGGGLNTPALFLRSELPDPFKRIGARTAIHPVVMSVAHMPGEVNPFYGAPQSIASDHFQWKDGATGPMGYKLEVPPIHPGIAAQIYGSIGASLKQDAAQLPHTHAMLALLRDGFVGDSEGGQVRLGPDGNPVLDYDMSDYAWDGARRALLSMVEAQFVAGAKEAKPMHLDATYYTSWAQAREAIAQLPLKKFRTGLFSAHLMGGSAMSEDPKLGVINSQGRHHQIDNLSVMDGSAFPTSIGANPQLSVYGLVAQNATALVAALQKA